MGLKASSSASQSAFPFTTCIEIGRPYIYEVLDNMPLVPHNDVCEIGSKFLDKVKENI